MKSTTTRRAAALLLAAPLALAACSSTSSSPAPSGSGSGATSSTASLGDLTPGQAVDRATFFAVTKAVAEKNKTYAYSTEIGDKGSVMTSSGVVDNSDAGDRKRQLTIKDSGGTESQMVIAGGQVYAKAGTDAAAKWVKSPISPKVEAVLAGAAQRLEEDKSIATAITYVGEEDVKGVKTRHFSVTVDPTKATATAAPTGGSTSASPAPSASGTPATSAPATASGAASSPASATKVEYWLDDQNRTRKMVHTVAGLPTTTFYEKWGESVTITVPASDQVTTSTATPASTATTKS